MTLPVFFEHILGLLVSTSDFLITGKFLAKEHLAAVCSSGYVVWGLQSVFTFVSVGATAMTARYIGGGLPEKANRAMHQAFNGAKPHDSTLNATPCTADAVTPSELISPKNQSWHPMMVIMSMPAGMLIQSS